VSAVVPAGPAAASAAGTVLILGATSPIARHIALSLAERGHALLLAGRDSIELERVAGDVRARTSRVVPIANPLVDDAGARARVVAHPAVRTCAFDALEEATHAPLLRELGREPFAGVVIATGVLGDAARARVDARHAADITNANYAGLVGLLTSLADRLEQQGRGFIVGLGSVAGDRGRQSNYVYGAAKGALALFLQGLRNRLAPRGIQVVTVKLGFVDTAMTWGLPLPLPAASPQAAARAVLRALEAGRDVAYVPGWWRWVMLLIRAIPEFLFKRLKL
jgi:short-subunit dehydrogenase